MRIMIYDNLKGMPPELGMALFGAKPRQIGLEYTREHMPTRFGVLHTLTFYLWSRYRYFRWINEPRNKV